MIKCKICNKELNGFKGFCSHLRIHKISSKKYYDRYYRNYRRDEGFCEECGKETKFYGLGSGYSKYCSLKCTSKSKEYLEKRKKTYLERYGVKHITQSKEIREIIKQTLLERNKISQINNKPLFNFYAQKIGWVEEVRKDPINKDILNIRCKKCGEWFVPNLVSLRHRINNLNLYSGVGSYLYCSDDCKQECILYHYKVTKKDDPSYEEPENPRHPYWRQLVLKRANYTCEKCGEPGHIAHHELPVKTHPFFANDIDNGWCVCDTCHQRFHQLPGCTTGDIAKMVCYV